MFKKKFVFDISIAINLGISVVPKKNFHKISIKHNVNIHIVACIDSAWRGFIINSDLSVSPETIELTNRKF